MRKLAVLLICAFAASSLFASARVNYSSGDVTYMHGGVWSQAPRDTVLSPSDRIKTGPSSKALVIVDDRSRIWVAPNSEMEISSLDKENVFKLFLGRIKAKVKLIQGQKFQVKTPVSVASVRGTEFVIDWGGQLFVVEGKVDFSGIDLKNMVQVAEGWAGLLESSGKPASREMSDKERAALLSEWLDFESSSSGAGESLRDELRQTAGTIRHDLSQARELTNEIKESDISTGRTMRDVHGNLVRVEQHILRPDSNTLQFINLTKRADYTYSDKQNLGYYVPRGSRLDVMDVTMRMNMALPDQMTEWPGYISSKGDDMHPESVNVVMTNQDDRIVCSGSWKLKGQTDEKGDSLSEDRLVFSTMINGWTVDGTYKPEQDQGARYQRDVTKDGSSSGDLWSLNISPDMKLVKDGQVKYVNLYSETYIINNSGSIQNLNNFASSSENPFALLKQVAGEEIIFCREYDRTSSAESSFLRKGNLDLIITPDAVIAVAEKLAGQVGDLKKGSDK